MTQYPKRLIKVNLPIKRISALARREKSIRHGHISTLYIWRLAQALSVLHPSYTDEKHWVDEMLARKKELES